MTGFADLDDDVLYLILDYLYLERVAVLHSLRLTSSRLKDFADAVAHRSLSFVDDDAHEQITYRLAERLIDPCDKLRYYVRDLAVIDFKGDGESYCLNSKLITDCISHVQRLDSFSWKCDAPVPRQTLDILQQRFPKARLCASVRSIDRTLFSIARLYRLEVSVPCVGFYGEYSVSLFGVLKEALIRLPDLCHFSLDTHPEANVGQTEGNALCRLQMPLETDDKLPSLISLDLRSKSYDFDMDHCKRLLKSLDCDRLQHLTLGSSNPSIFFEIFQGATPNLTHLDVSYASKKDDPRHHRLGSLSSFVAVLASLKRLVFRCDKLDLRADFPRMLMDKHGPTLVHLSLQARQQNIEGPNFAGNVRKFLWKFTNLQYLDMAFPDIRNYHRCADCEGCQWGEANHFSFVPPLPSLQNVRLSIRAPSSERSLYAYINKHAHCAICHLWTTFIDQPGSQLETLSIRFWRWEMTGRQTCFKELVYDTTRLRGRLTIRVRHHREIPNVVYKEVWEDRRDRRVLVAFEVSE